jgi:hypothetical protein
MRSATALAIMWVQVLDPLRQHEVRRPAELAVVRSTNVSSSRVVPGQSGADVSLRRQRFGAAWPAYMPAGHREVHALQPDAGGQAHGGGVAGHEHPVGDSSASS